MWRKHRLEKLWKFCFFQFSISPFGIKLEIKSISKIRKLMFHNSLNNRLLFWASLLFQTRKTFWVPKSLIKRLKTNAINKPLQQELLVKAKIILKSKIFTYFRMMEKFKESYNTISIMGIEESDYRGLFSSARENHFKKS